jgi:hemoglobin
VTNDPTFEAVGGHATFVALVDAFYEGVANDPVLRPMYPEDELDGAKWRLTAFLEQYWGGPTTYSDERGHPRLRMRHQAFPVDDVARDRWLTHMVAAVDSIDLAPMHRLAMLEYFDRAAHAMVNTIGDDERGGRPLL